jgi:PadR family transcriptional regulator, regulatory protein PadR
MNNSNTNQNKVLSSDLIRGHVDSVILNLLMDGDKYGYAITKLVYEKSQKLYELKEATMYSSLRRLENDNYVTSYWGDETQGGRRKYFHITQSGIELLKESKQNWTLTKEILDRLFSSSQ